MATTYSLATKELKLYIDGVLISAKQNCKYQLEHSSDQLGIGGLPGPVLDANKQVRYNSFPGSIDDIRIYNRCLTNEDILAIYRQGGFNALPKQMDSVPTRGLIAHYPFNGNATDLSGNAYHGTVTGAEPAVDRFDNAGQCYRFDGVDDFISIGNLNDTRLSLNEITYSCFIFARSRSSEPWSRIISKPGMPNGYALGWNQDNNNMLQMFLVYDATPTRTPYDQVGIDNSALIGKWIHIATTYSVMSRELKMYINGTLAASKSGCNSMLGPAGDTLFVGGIRGVYDGNGVWRTQAFPGSIDDLRIYDRVLSESEIKSLFHEGGYRR